jgi:hypothetical protein
MRWADKLLLRLRSLLRRERIEHELDDELRFHIEQQIGENLAAGMTPEEARYAARRSIGGLAQIQEECRDIRRVNLIKMCCKICIMPLECSGKAPDLPRWPCFHWRSALEPIRRSSA